MSTSPITVQRIRETMNSVAIARKKIHSHATECKSNISTCVSRHMETLRSRELFLLHQVDVLRHAKDEMLRRQEAELHEALGSLEASSLYGTVSQSLKTRLQSLDFQLAECPVMMFTADDDLLRRYMREFGRVHDGEEGMTPFMSSCAALDSEDVAESDDSDEEEDDDSDDGVEAWLSRASCAGVPATAKTHSESLRYFAEVKQSPVNNWLLASDVELIRAKYEIGASYPVATMKYFREVCNDVKHWLQQHEQHAQQDANRQDKVTKVATTSQHMNADERVRVLQQAVTRYFDSVATSSLSWLRGQGQGQPAVAAHVPTFAAAHEDLPLQLCSHDESISKRLRNWSPFAGAATDCSRLQPEVSTSSPFDNAKSDSVSARDLWLHPSRRDNSGADCSLFARSRRASSSVDQWLHCDNRSFLNGAAACAEQWLHPCRRPSTAICEKAAMSDSTPYHWTLCCENAAALVPKCSRAKSTAEEKPPATTKFDARDWLVLKEEKESSLASAESAAEMTGASPFAKDQNNVKEWLQPQQSENSPMCPGVTLATQMTTSAVASSSLRKEDDSDVKDWEVVHTKASNGLRQTEEDDRPLILCSAAQTTASWCKFNDDHDVNMWLAANGKESTCNQRQPNSVNVAKLPLSGLQWSGECRR